MPHVAPCIVRDIPSPDSRTYSAKITFEGVPSKQPLASSHIKPYHYSAFFRKFQVFWKNFNDDILRIFKCPFVHGAQFWAIFGQNRPFLRFFRIESAAVF